MNRYQKNTGKRKCIFLLALAIFGLVLVLIFKPRRHHPPPSRLSGDAPAAQSDVAGALDAMRKLAPVRVRRRYPVDVSFLRT